MPCTAPLEQVKARYGLGLAEMRFGSFLHNDDRSEFIISSEVGLLRASKTAENKEYFPSRHHQRRGLR
jgi:D-threo-aldose 1-dehydrogenase